MISFFSMIFLLLFNTNKQILFYDYDEFTKFYSNLLIFLIFSIKKKVIGQNAYFAAMCSKFLCPLPGAKLMLNLEFERRSDTDLCKVNEEKMIEMLHLKYSTLHPSFYILSQSFSSVTFWRKKKLLRPISYVQYIYISKYWTCMEKIPRIFHFFFLLISHC